MTDRPPETGWLPDTPIGDSALRRFVHNQGELNAVLAEAAGGRHERDDAVSMADGGSPVGYFNQAILLRPLADVDDGVLDRIDAFYADSRHGSTLLSLWPTPDLAPRGWSLIGHPAFVLRSPGPLDHEAPPGVEVRDVTTVDDLAAFEGIMVEGYPLPEASGLPPGSLFPLSAIGGALSLRLGLLDGRPVAAAARSIGHGVVNLCSAATLPAARRRGVWETLVWRRVADAPELPAVAYTSDFSRPGFVRMGFVPVTRFTLWARG